MEADYLRVILMTLIIGLPLIIIFMGFTIDDSGDDDEWGPWI